MQSPCANSLDGVEPCGKEATMACGNCRLVSYCSKSCQVAHWPHHKRDCKSPLMKDSWLPDWDITDRKPAFVNSVLDGAPFVSWGNENKFLWGNMPAIDLLKLAENEGGGYEKPLALLFAASGDPRNMLLTHASIPSTYSAQISIVMNDRDLDIVSRNLIITLVLLRVESAEAAVECAIHIWYSTLLSKAVLETLQQIRPLIQDVCTKISSKPSDTILAKTWTFSPGKVVRAVLQQTQWMDLLRFFDNPEGLTATKARKIRSAVTQAPHRLDYRDRFYFQQSPTQRVCTDKFQRDGILLPFGASQHGFEFPNPTFFRSSDTWPMNDSADPLAGWDLGEIFATGPVMAKNDIYGKLYNYLRGLLHTFRRRLDLLFTSFTFYCLDVRALPNHLSSKKFDRIEVSNISDAGYVGINPILNLMSPLLHDIDQNSHSTLLTLFLNAVDETRGRYDISEMTRELEALTHYLKPSFSASEISAEFLRFSYAKNMVCNADKYFNRYMLQQGFSQAGKASGLIMKEKHTIIDKWPLRLKLHPGQRGAKEEFDMLLGSRHSGMERYVEWKRVAKS